MGLKCSQPLGFDIFNPVAVIEWKIAMIKELAIVVKVEGSQIWVESRKNSACGGCQRKVSCTANVFDSVLRKKSVQVDSDVQLKTGDEVIVETDEGLLLRASVVLYLLPLAGLFIGAGMADWLVNDNNRYAELWIAGSAVLSFLLSLWLIGKMQSQLLLNRYARPVAIRKV